MKITFTNLLTLMSLPSALTGFCFWIIQRNINKRDAIREEKEKTKEKNEILLIKSVGAAIALGEATACAIRDGKCNGEMSAALEYARNVKHEQKNFLTETSIKNIY